jgi:hypothetical protein
MSRFFSRVCGTSTRITLTVCVLSQGVRETGRGSPVSPQSPSRDLIPNYSQKVGVSCGTRWQERDRSKNTSAANGTSSALTHSLTQSLHPRKADLVENHVSCTGRRWPSPCELSLLIIIHSHIPQIWFSIRGVSDVFKHRR